MNLTITPEIYQKAQKHTAGNGMLEAYNEFAKTNPTIEYRFFCHEIQKMFTIQQMKAIHQKLKEQSQATQLPCGCSCNCGRLSSKQNDLAN